MARPLSEEVFKVQEIKRIEDKLKAADLESLGMSLGDVHAKGLFSLVFDGRKAGHLPRAYLAGRKVVAKLLDRTENGAMTIPAYKYRSQLNGGDGTFSYSHDQCILMEEYVIPPAATIYLSNSDIHTVSCSKGAIWVVEELGFKTKETYLFGSPFCVDDLYRKPEQFEVNNNYQRMRRAVKKLINEHALCAA